MIDEAVKHEFTAPLVAAYQHVKPLGHQARGEAGRGTPYFTFNPNGCLGHRARILQGWVSV